GYSGRALIDEGEEPGRIPGLSVEGCDYFFIRVQDAAEGNGDGRNPRLLQLLVGFGFGIRAIGIEIYQDEVAQGGGDLGPGEHVRLHPMTVGAGIAGKVYEDEFALSPGLGERLAILILEPH